MYIYIYIYIYICKYIYVYIYIYIYLYIICVYIYMYIYIYIYIYIYLLTHTYTYTYAYTYTCTYTYAYTYTYTYAFKGLPPLPPTPRARNLGTAVGVPRGMEKQGLFGHVPAAGFFSHADDQKQHNIFIVGRQDDEPKFTWNNLLSVSLIVYIVRFLFLSPSCFPGRKVSL